MGKHTKCVIGVCNNDKRYPERMVKHSNVIGNIVMHSLPTKDEKIRSTWIHQILKGRTDLNLAKDIPKNCFVCSNHFVDGKPTTENPSPTLFLTVSTNSLPTPTKFSRKRSVRGSIAEAQENEIGPNAKRQLFHMTPGINEHSYASNIVLPSQDPAPLESVSKTRDVQCGTTDVELDLVSFRFAHITRECDVCTFTGIEGTKMFRAVFDFLKRKASCMTYWDGQKKTLRPRSGNSSVERTESMLNSSDYNLDPKTITHYQAWSITET